MTSEATAMEGVIDYIKKDYLPYEVTLGVGINRQLRDQQQASPPSHVAYHEPRSQIIIDIQNDPALREAVQRVIAGQLLPGNSSGEEQLAAAANIAQRVVGLQPYDTTGKHHNQQTRLLGDSFNHPAWCIDRALLLEAALKAARVARNAYPLISNWQLEKGGPDIHADLLFELPNSGQSFVAVTTRENAGKIMPLAEYIEALKRPPKGVVRVDLSPDKTQYFEPVG